MTATETTDSGFIWGPMQVKRLIAIDGTVTLLVTAGGNEVQVYASKTGRSLRVWKNHEEMQVPEWRPRD